jgi:hypothetical protein
MDHTILSRQQGIDRDIDDLELQIRGDIDTSEILIRTIWDPEPDRAKDTSVGLTASSAPLISFAEGRDQIAKTIVDVYPGNSEPSAILTEVEDVFDELASKIEENRVHILDEPGRKILDATRRVTHSGQSWELVFDTPLSRTETATVVIDGDDWIQSRPPVTEFRKSPGFRTVHDNPFQDSSRWVTCRNLWQELVRNE